MIEPLTPPDAEKACDSTSTARRQQGGRWAKGQSGNPRGRAPGESPLTKLRRSITADLPDILRVLTQQAKDGDVQSARLLIERVLPPLRPESLPRPLGIESDGAPTEQARAVLKTVATGELGINEAVALLAALSTLVKVREADEIEQRLRALEGQADEHCSTTGST